MTRLLSALGALTAAGAFAAGCGGGNDSSSGDTGAATTPATTAASPPASSSGGASSLALKADESSGLSFDPKSLSAKAGKVTITMDNPSGDSQPHAVAIEGPGGVAQSGAIVQPGGTSKVSADLKAGTYTFFCPVDAHRQAGMEGTLTVR
jgi:plastocyanin